MNTNKEKKIACLLQMRLLLFLAVLLFIGFSIRRRWEKKLAAHGWEILQHVHLATSERCHVTLKTLTCPEMQCVFNKLMLSILLLCGEVE